MTRREWLCWVATVFMGVEAGRLASAAAALSGATDSPFNAVRLIAWGCVVLLLRRPVPAVPIGGGMSLALLAGMALLLLPLDRALFNFAAWVLLSGAALLVLLARDWESTERRAAAVMLAIAAQGFLAKWLAILFESPILAFDTALAGKFMRWVTPGSVWAGHAIRPPGGVGVTLYLACSSFANLSLVWLCFVSLAALDGVARRVRALTVIAGVSLVVIVVNTMRIVLMAQSLSMYEYWHYGRGGQTLALALSITTVALCSLGSRWAAPR
jgi:hypothetical protein